MVIDIQYLVSLAMFCLAAAITPGPNNIMLLTSGLNFGVKKSLPHLFGVNFGFCLMVFLVGIGLSSIFQRYEVLHSIIKTVGVLYLLWLALKIAMLKPVSDTENEAKPLGFFGAAFYQWVNAKAWIVITSVTSTFTSTDGNMTLQVSLITMAFLVIGLPSNIIWLAGGHMISRLIKHVVFYRVFNVSMALLLAFSVVPLVLNGA